MVKVKKKTTKDKWISNPVLRIQVGFYKLAKSGCTGQQISRLIIIIIIIIKELI